MIQEEKELLQKWPYWGDVADGRSLCARDGEEAIAELSRTLDDEWGRELESRFIPPQKSLGRVCDYLEEVASKPRS